MMTLAQISFGSMSIGQIAIWIIVVAAIVAVVFAYCKHAGVVIPPFVVTVFWIVVLAAVAVVAVNFLLGLR